MKLYNCAYSEVVIKKGDRVKTLAGITTMAAPREKQLKLENGLKSDAKSNFQYKLTATPSVLFKDGFMRKADKAQLQHKLELKELTCHSE